MTSCQAVMGKYLDTLAEQGFVKKHRSGKGNYYINVTLVRLFLDASGDTWTRLQTGRKCGTTSPTEASQQSIA